MSNPLQINFAENITPDICTVELMQMSEAWRGLALQLGSICLVIGFVIGLFAGYYYCKGKYDGSSE